MPLMKSRIPFSVERPYRPVRPVSSKIIFLALKAVLRKKNILLGYPKFIVK